MQSKFLFIIVFCGFVISPALYADIGDWTTFTNKTDIRDIGVYENCVWCATNGGIFKYTVQDSSYEEFTNTTGLASNDITALEIDPYGNIWLGTRDGYINVYWADTQTWETIDDIVEYEEHVIYDLKLYGDSLFVALDIGISLYHRIYDSSRREVKETYKNLGEGFQVEIPVKCIYLNGKDIWAGTDYGLAKSNLDISNLQAPQSWTNYTTDNSTLSGNSIRSIAALNDEIFVATDFGICKFNDSTWARVSTGLSGSDSTNVNTLAVNEDQLYAGVTGGVFRFTGSQWSKFGYSIDYVSSIAFSESGEIWVGRIKIANSEGFAIYNPNTDLWETFVPNGPGGNTFKGMAIDHDGVLWCCSSSDGIFRFDGTEWKNYKSAEYGFVNNIFWTVEVDEFNNKWIGGWGTGVVKIDVDDNLTIYQNEVSSGSSYVPVTNCTIDLNGNVWFTIYNILNC